MDNSELQDRSAPIPTEFGKMLRIERINRGMKNTRKMAEALGITASMLSEIENGKKESYPDIDFLIRCRDFFGWKIQENDDETSKREKMKKTLELFEKGFLSSDNISLDMKYYQGNKRNLIVKTILSLLFLPEIIPFGTMVTPGESKEIVKNLVEEAGKYLSPLFDLVEQLHPNNFVLCDLPSPPARKKVTRNRKGKQPVT